MAAPVPMPVISRGVTAYTNDDYSGAFPASLAVNSNYADYWRCVTAPTGGTDSGTLTTPVYLALDLSSVPVAQRQQVVFVFYNDPSTGAYNPQLIGNNSYNIPRDYTIDINSAPGGSYPAAGWSTLATVTNNPYHSRQHAVNMAGANWARINVTGVNGSALNNNVQINVDIHDCSGGNQDNAIILGDSITARGFDHSNIGLPSNGTLPQMINSLKSDHFPIIENGGIGGYLSTDGANNINTWLPLFSGRYVGLCYGTNDANNAAVGDPTFGPNYTTRMTAMLNAVVSAGKIPIMPRTIPWGKTTNIQGNGPEINTRLASLFSAFPTAIQGPDLWAFFSSNPTLINNADVHPTDPDGYQQMRQLWASTLASAIYSGRQLVLSRRRFFV